MPISTKLRHYVCMRCAGGEFKRLHFSSFLHLLIKFSWHRWHTLQKLNFRNSNFNAISINVHILEWCLGPGKFLRQKTDTGWKYGWEKNEMFNLLTWRKVFENLEKISNISSAFFMSQTLGENDDVFQFFPHLHQAEWKSKTVIDSL